MKQRQYREWRESVGNSRKKTENQFYSYREILKRNATYNMVIGERSNGKTYGALLMGLENHVKSGYKEDFCLIRRFQDDFVGKRGVMMFSSLVANDEIRRLTNGEWTDVFYYSSKWYLCRYEGQDAHRVKASRPFCYAFAISSMEHDKSTSYPSIKTIIFDEFLTRQMYLSDEFVLFMNVVSTIVRQRDDVRIFMLGNTVNKYCPYFAEMGLTHIKNQEQGTIDVYDYGDTGLRVAVEYCASIQKYKKSNKYFAFDNPKLNMVKSGSWEIDIYPHKPVKFTPEEIVFSYFILFEEELLQCDVVMKEDRMFTFVHRKTTPLKDEDSDLVFSPRYDSRPNWRRNIASPPDKLGRKIASLFLGEKMFFQDNEVGEIIWNYAKWCTKH